jgi:hypothetical protein
MEWGSLPMKRLLVASVYANTRQHTSRNGVWYGLQRRFLDRTTPGGCDFAVYLNGVSPKLFGQDVHIIRHHETNPAYGHIVGIQGVLEYFRSVDYEHYLILDSDCFPIWNGWYEVLCELLRRFDKQYAAPVRVENLDVFPHPSAFFMTAAGLRDSLDFRRAPVSNLLHETFDEVRMGHGVGESGFRELSFVPLLRSNVRSEHPVWSSIYHHLFYHHGAGSRLASTRSTGSGYFSHFVPDEVHKRKEEELFARLQSDPDGYVHHLLGGAGPPGMNRKIEDSRIKRSVRWLSRIVE